MENNPYRSDSDVEEYYQTAISNLSKQKIDVYHQLSRDRIGDIDLEYLRAGFEGLEYRRFIKILFQITSCDDLLTGISGNFSALNPVERKLRRQFLSYMTNMPLIETSGAQIVIKYCMRSVSLLSKC